MTDRRSSAAPIAIAALLLGLLDRMYRDHTLGHCDRDCNWCFELKVGDAKQVAEYRRIEALKRKAKPRRRHKQNKKKALSVAQGRRLEPTDLQAASTKHGNSPSWLSAPRVYGSPASYRPGGNMLLPLKKGEASCSREGTPHRPKCEAAQSVENHAHGVSILPEVRAICAECGLTLKVSP
jgi:hypothetical protein